MVVGERKGSRSGLGSLGFAFKGQEHLGGDSKKTSAWADLIPNFVCLVKESKVKLLALMIARVV